MELEKIKSKFDKEIKKFIKRLEINYVVCDAPRYSNGKSWTEKECDKYLKENPRNKLESKNIFLLNDHTRSETATQDKEYYALNEALKVCREFLSKEITEFCKDGKNQYELNKLLKNAFDLIDSNIVKMNYNSWLEEISKNDPYNSFILLVNKKKIYKHPVYFDITTYCSHLITFEFGHRELLLYRLKDYLIDIYSQYLLLPTIGVNPKIKYTCKPTDICELIMAIEKTPEITDSEKLKAILIEMFEVGDIYSKTCHEISKRVLGKGVFVKKMAENLNNIPTPRTRKKSSK
ncbi:MAG: hypothetical protein IPP81_09140 [Chitinophagaceae bacterium]|nr:hypothetical protein [Chitinophagaceae bacterium]